MATVLDKELRRAITVDGADYVVSFDTEGMRVTGKGKRKPQVELRWRDLLSGEAALAIALNASLVSATTRAAAARPSPQKAAPARRPPSQKSRSTGERAARKPTARAARRT